MTKKELIETWRKRSDQEGKFNTPGNLALAFGFKACADALESMTEESPWISVLERLPIASGAVLVCDLTGGFDAVEFDLDHKQWLHKSFDCHAPITHWMPIPPL